MIYYTRQFKTKEHIVVLETRRTLNTEERLETQRGLFALRMKLIAAVHDVEFTLNTVCQSCGTEFPAYDAIEMLKCEREKNYVECGVCNTEIRPLLRYVRSPIRGECYLGSLGQLGENLKKMSHLSQTEIIDRHCNVFLAGLIYNGSLGAAFSWPAGIVYTHSEYIMDWRRKTRWFLGKMPDGYIADCTGTNRKEVGKYRRALGIAEFDRNNLLLAVAQ